MVRRKSFFAWHLQFFFQTPNYATIDGKFSIQTDLSEKNLHSTVFTQQSICYKIDGKFSMPTNLSEENLHSIIFTQQFTNTMRIRQAPYTSFSDTVTSSSALCRLSQCNFWSLYMHHEKRMSGKPCRINSSMEKKRLPRPCRTRTRHREVFI